MDERNPQQITPNYTPTTRSPTLSTTGDPDIASPSLRTRLSRYFGLRRIPRRARPKSLTRLRSDHNQAQAQDTSNHLQLPPRIHNGRERTSLTVRRDASTPIVFRPTKSDPRFVGLEDRRAKVPVATPTFVRKVDFHFSTDQTMATRGSGSGLSEATGNLDDTLNGDHQSVDTRSNAGEEASMKRRGSWASIKKKTKTLWRKKAKADKQ
ncbi:MAG: hypothetical protein Q9221_004768 [Calogaya cf. arnoldii]